MANTAEGLEIPAADEQVNSEAGFAAALAGKGVEPDEGDTSTDTSVALGLETVEPGANRGPDGRFAPAKPDTPAQPQDTSTERGASVVTSDDPAIADYLAKYGGDPEKALAAAVEAQRLIGRRDEERDTLREQVAKLTGIVETLQATATALPPQAVLTDEQVEERAVGLVESQGGFFQAATLAANESITGDARIYDSIIERWALESPIQATRFDTDFQLWKREQAAPPSAPDPWVEEQKTATGMEGTILALKKELGEETWAQVAPKMGDALDAMPPQVAAMIADNDPAIRLAGTRLVADRATLLAGAAPQVQEVADEGMPDSVRRKLAGASVATAGLRPAVKAPEGQISREEAVKAFKQEIMSAETTSVASGLTYGK